MSQLAEAVKQPTFIDKVFSFKNDPLGFVYYIFKWGEDELESESGPDVWQRDLLKKLGEETLTVENAIQIAVASGHGIGKSCLISWIILWFISTRPNPQIVVTANTSQQLNSKTWRELAKWQKLALNGSWFEWTATRFYYKGSPETWFAVAQPWSKERSEAFAGTHEKHVLVLYDEASKIEDIIWEVTEGAMTTPGAIWVVFGNPTQNVGRFKDCFTRLKHRWTTFKIDSRTAKKANKAQIETWVEDYGEDSDFCRVRVKGEFPKTAVEQFISEDTVAKAMARSLNPEMFEFQPVVVSVDVARYGDDQSVICIRQGLKVHEIHKYRQISLMELAERIANQIKEWKPQGTFVDSVGVGAGVTDRLRQLGYKVFEVNAGENAGQEQKYYNKRIEIWDKMKLWLKEADIPNDDELKQELIGPEYGFDRRGRLQLEKKSDMKKRGLNSPDTADAISMSFAFPLVLNEKAKVLTPAEKDWLIITGQGNQGKMTTVQGY
jgi:hypothetical protein